MPDEPNKPDPQQTAADLEKARLTVEAAQAAGGLPTEITLPDGQKFSATSTAELIQKLADAKAQANAHIAQIQRENAEMRQRLAGIEETQNRLRTALSPDKGTEGEKFDKLQYYNLFQTDPFAAYQYARKFDPEVSELKERVEEMRYEQLGRVILALHPGLSGKTEDINKVLEHAEKLGGFTQESIEASIAVLSQKGAISVGKPAPVGPTPPPLIPGAPSTVIPQDLDAELARKVEQAPTVEAARAIMEQTLQGTGRS